MIPIDYSKHIATNFSTRANQTHEAQNWGRREDYVIGVKYLAGIIGKMDFKCIELDELVIPDSAGAVFCNSVKALKYFSVVRSALVDYNRKFNSFATIFARDMRTVFRIKKRDELLLA